MSRPSIQCIYVHTSPLNYRLPPSCVMIVVNGSQLCSSYHTLVVEVLPLGAMLQDHGVVNFKTTCVTEIRQACQILQKFWLENQHFFYCNVSWGSWFKPALSFHFSHSKRASLLHHQTRGMNHTIFEERYSSLIFVVIQLGRQVQ